MKRLVILAVLLANLTLFTTAFAGSQVGTIVNLTTRASDGIIYFTLTGTYNSPPDCATTSQWMIRDETTNAGKNQYAQLLTAYATGKTITIYGNNTCNRMAGFEDVETLVMQPQ